MVKCRVLVPSGVLGSGFPDGTLAYGAALQPDVIAIDGGSTDSGPYYLGRGASKMTREAIKHDLRRILRLRDRLEIPFLVGSCGTCGADGQVDWVSEICQEILQEENLYAKIALIYCEQSAAELGRYREKGKIKPLEPVMPLDQALLDSCSHIVALAGPEPYGRAVAQGADIVLGGRTSDPAVLAAIPLSKGCPAGPVWHAAKVAECGAFCTDSALWSGVIFEVDEDGFEIEPLMADSACTPHTVSAHMLYENADPFAVSEPGGRLNTAAAVYRAVSDRRVRVEGSQFDAAASYSMKLEGARARGYQTIMLAGIQAPEILAHIEMWLEKLTLFLKEKVGAVLNISPAEYDLSLRAYGWNGINAPLAEGKTIPPPHEVGVLLTVTAKTQAMATKIARLSNPYLLHFPLREEGPMPTFAFPFSPAEVERGQIFEFVLNHIVEVAAPFDLVRCRMIDGGKA